MQLFHNEFQKEYPKLRHDNHEGYTSLSMGNNTTSKNNLVSLCEAVGLQ